MNIRDLVGIIENTKLPSQEDAIAAVNQADSIEDIKSLCELTEDGGADGVFADLHIQALRRFVEVSQPSRLDAYSIAWMASMYGENVKNEKRTIFREACDKGGAFTEIHLAPGCEDGRRGRARLSGRFTDLDVGNLSLSTDGGIVLICREGDWDVSLEEILGEPMDVKSVVLSDRWDVEDSRISEFLKKLSDNYLPDLEDITVFNVNGERFQQWMDAFRNTDLLSGAKSLKRLLVDGEFVPPAGAARKLEGEDATFAYEGEALERLLGPRLMTKELTVELKRGNYLVKMEYLGEESEQGNLHTSFSMKRNITFGGKELEVWSFIGSMATTLPCNAPKAVVEQRAEKLMSALEGGPAPEAVGSGNGKLVLSKESVEKLQAIALEKD
jgi:hypothetical protein